MNIEVYRAALSSIKRQHRPSTGADLDGMIEDFYHGLMETSLFHRIRVRKTGSPDCLIEATCSLRSSDTTVDTVESCLSESWAQGLRYGGPGIHAHIITANDEAVRLEGVTVPGGADFYVSARIVVSLRERDT
jgi:hypothetical protein